MSRIVIYKEEINQVLNYYINFIYDYNFNYFHTSCSYNLNHKYYKFFYSAAIKRFFKIKDLDGIKVNKIQSNNNYLNIEDLTNLSMLINESTLLLGEEKIILSSLINLSLYN